METLIALLGLADQPTAVLKRLVFPLAESFESIRTLAFSAGESGGVVVRRVDARSILVVFFTTLSNFLLSLM